MNTIDIFASTKPQSGEFFKFKNVGDGVQGTYIDMRNGKDSFGNEQAIYVLQDASGKIWNLGFRQTNAVIHERMNGIQFGQIVGFRLDELRDSKRLKNQDGSPTKVKIIRIYADSKLVDQDWLNHQKEVETNYIKPIASPKTSVNNTPPSEEEWNKAFSSPATAVPTGAAIPVTEIKPRNETMDAIRKLAITKGLINDAISEEDGDKIIEKYTDLPMIEENLTKIIISISGFTKPV